MRRVQLVERYDVVEVVHLRLVVERTSSLGDAAHVLDVVLHAGDEQRHVDVTSLGNTRLERQSDGVVDGAVHLEVVPQSDHEAALELHALGEQVDVPLPRPVLVRLGASDGAEQEERTHVVLRHHGEVFDDERRAPHLARVVTRPQLVRGSKLASGPALVQRTRVVQHRRRNAFPEKIGER